MGPVTQPYFMLRLLFSVLKNGIRNATT